jgi:hypothetical protein
VAEAFDVKDRFRRFSECAGRKCATKAWVNSVELFEVQCCIKDEGRPLGIGLQELVPNHLKLQG